MRTKTLLLAAAALSAGVLASSAQVYSANVVGYVNSVYVPGTTLTANPLKGSPDNTLNTIMPIAPDGTLAIFWDTATQDYALTSATYIDGAGWDPNPTVPPGLGFMIQTTTQFTNTYVGDVMQGSLTNQLITGNQFWSSIPPIGGPLSSVLTNCPAVEGDAVFVWDTAAVPQDYNPAGATYLDGVGWDPDLTIAVGQGFLYQRVGPPAQYVRTFVVQ